MRTRIHHPLLTAALAVSLFYGVLGTEIRCTTAEARPSLEALQAEIAELRATQLHVFDGNGMAIGIPAGEGGVSPFLLDLGGHDWLRVYIGSDGSLGTAEVPLSFAQNQCLGTAYVLGGSDSGIGIPTLFSHGDAPDTRYFVPVSEPSFEIIERSIRESSGLCVHVAHTPRMVTNVEELALEDIGLEFPLATPIYLAPLEH
jgi:hypothetical protein